MTRAGLIVLLLGGVAAAVAADTRGLERRANAFYDELARGRRAAAERVFPDLERDLAAAVESLRDGMDERREALLERDGDLDALYRSPAWREDEVASLVLAYHLAWVRYQGAQLVAAEAQKKALLRKAAEGFAQFTVVSDVPEVYSESLYGRGLALMDLGEYREAIADLETAAKIPRTASKAKAALAEARRRAAGGKPAAAPEPADDLARLRSLLAAAATTPAKARKASDLARGLAARGGDWPAKVSLAVRETLGAGTKDVPRSSFALALLGQLAVDARRCGDLPALVAAGRDVRDAGRDRWRPELLFLHAGCVLNAGRQAEAAALFEALEREFPASARAEEAAYYRARALDVGRHDDPALAAAYEPALRAFLERHGRSERAAEMRYLLGELLRERGDCPAASPLYRQIERGAFAARARLALLECRVAMVGGADEAERRSLLTALRDFASSPPERADARTLAKAHLLGGLVAARVQPPDDDAVIALLGGFEQRFPAESEWHPIARRLRLEARLRAGRLDEAEADVDALLAAPRDAATRKVLARFGRDLMRRAPRHPLGRKIWAALAADGTDPQDRATLGELQLAAGDGAAARASFEAVLAVRPDSAQARRGAARAAAALGDHDAAMAHWRHVIDGSTPGGTSWYEARLAQFELLAGNGHTAEACDLARRAAGQSKTAGGDVLASRLAERAAATCR